MTRPKIAVVHEERAVCEYLRAALGGHGEVKIFAMGEELLTSAARQEMDCIFAEAESARRILQHQADGHTASPVVSLAAEPNVSEAVKSIKLGAVDYLSSHAGEAELVAALESGLRQRRTGVPERYFHTELALEPMLDGMERELINAALARSQGVVGGRQGAAALLGVTRTGLLYKMKRLHIHRSQMTQGEVNSGVEDDMRAEPAGNYSGESSSSTTA